MISFVFLSTNAIAQDWSTSGNTGSPSYKLGVTDLNDVNFYTNNMIRATLTKDGDFGVGVTSPRARQEILYCPVSSISDIGLIVTRQECPGTNALPFNSAIPDIIGNPITLDTGGFELIDTFIIPFSFKISNFTNILLPLYGTAKPLVWVRTELPSGTSGNPSGPDKYDTKFIVMPDGSTGINVAQPRCALDVRGSQAENRPVAIFGSRAIGTGTPNPTSGLYQYYTQQLHIVPNLKVNGYNRISQLGDQGLFYSDGQGSNGANQNGSLVIAPWSENGDTSVGGLRMDKHGNAEFHGTVLATKVKVDAKWWSDFVFEPGYHLRSLQEIETFINQNGHLPDMPSEQEVLDEGVDIVEMQALQQQKIEELTLYIIELQKVIEGLEQKVEEIKE
jgi:hypothetical protein